MTKTIRIALTVALSLCILLILVAGACLTVMDDVPRWLLMPYGAFGCVSTWCVLDLIADVWGVGINSTVPKQPKPQTSTPGASRVQSQSQPSQRTGKRTRRDRF